MQIWGSIVLDALLDTAKIAPFLLLTYFLMEYVEHRMGERTLAMIRRADRLGPLAGGLLGLLPQCGFSAAAAGFYSGRVITAGTLIAVFLSTSDEMLPILLSSGTAPATILRILGVKALAGILFGFAVDFLFRRLNVRMIGAGIHDLCEHDHCECEKSLVLSAVRHALKILAFILLASVLLGALVELIGEENLGALILNQPIAGELLGGLIGLIPNCAASVAITTLYLEGGMSAGAMISGLLVGAGVGLLVLFRTNRKWKENLQLTAILYVCGVLGGCFVDFLGFRF